MSSFQLGNSIRKYIFWILKKKCRIMSGMPLAAVSMTLQTVHICKSVFDEQTESLSRATSEQLAFCEGAVRSSRKTIGQ